MRKIKDSIEFFIPGASYTTQSRHDVTLKWPVKMAQNSLSHSTNDELRPTSALRSAR